MLKRLRAEFLTAFGHDPAELRRPERIKREAFDAMSNSEKDKLIREGSQITD